MKLTRDQLVDPSRTVDREEAMAMVGLPVGRVRRPIERAWPETMRNLGASVRALQGT